MYSETDSDREDLEQEDEQQAESEAGTTRRTPPMGRPG